MILALDTNVLAYAEGVGDSRRQGLALELLDQLRQAQVVLPVQVLAELFAVLVRKGRRARGEARDIVLAWKDAFEIASTTGDALVSAGDLSVDRQLSPWDALVLAVAAESGCRLLVSEDLQDGFTWRGVTVVNPFTDSRNELLLAALAQ